MMDASRLKELIALQRDLHLRVIKLQCGLRASQSEVESLKTELGERRENEKRLNKSNNELKEKVVGLETRIADIETTVGSEHQSLSQGNTALEMLKKLDSEIRNKFEQWNGKQVDLQKEVEHMKKFLKNLEKPPIVVPDKDPINVPIHEDEDDDIQILTPPTCMAPSSPPGPASPADVFDFREDARSPVPGPSTKVINWLNTTGRTQKDNPRLRSTRRRRMPSSRSRVKTDRRWGLLHGVDSADMSQKTCLCGTKLTSRTNLNRHITYFTRDWKFSCKICQKPFSFGNKLNEHLKLAHNIHRRKESQAKTQYQSTANKSNSVQPTPQSSLTAPSTPTRPPCARDLSRRVTPIKIKLEHGKAVKTLNPAQFSSSAQPPNHTNATHGKDYARDFTCLCGLDFTNDGALNRHVRYYTIQRFRCRYCGRWFAYACYRNAHVLRTHKNLASSNGQSHSQTIV